MISKRKLIIIGFLVFVIFFAYQTKAQQVIGNSAGDIKSEYGSLSWTLGEPVIKTIKGNNYFLTQGFQQSNFIITEIEDTPSLLYEINVYPNPVTTSLIIHIANTNISMMSYNMVNSKGSVIKSGDITTSETIIPVQDIVPSIYFIKIFYKKKQTKTFKIVKC